MEVELNTLADFKRFLATKGATIQLIRHDFHNPQPGIRGAKFNFNPRTVEKLQTNSVKFSGGSWLNLSPASHFRFDGTDMVTVSLTDEAEHNGPVPFTFKNIMVYKCSVAVAPANICEDCQNGVHHGLDLSRREIYGPCKCDCNRLDFRALAAAVSEAPATTESPTA